jgi:hypothetical protein
VNSIDPAAHVPVVPVATCGSTVEAELKRAALEDAGIRAHVSSDTAGGLHPELAWGYDRGHRLMVAEHDVDAAREFLAELDAGEHALGGPEDQVGHPGTPRTHWLVWVGLATAVVFGVARFIAGLNL